MKNVLVFLKKPGEPEVRQAEFLSRPREHVHVRPLLAIEHDGQTPNFDSLKIDVKALLAMGFTEMRIEIEGGEQSGPPALPRPLPAFPPKPIQARRPRLPVAKVRIPRAPMGGPVQ
jgi:hypothetical protein